MIWAIMKLLDSENKAFVVLDEQERLKLHAVACPRQIAFIPDLPRTKSGKIMRRLPKARELGLPENDISTLEE